MRKSDQKFLRDIFDVLEPPSDPSTNVVKVGDMMVRTQSVGTEGVPADRKDRNNTDMNQVGGGVPFPPSTSQKSAMEASQYQPLTTQRQGHSAPLPTITINGSPVFFAKLYRDKTESTSDPHVMLKRMLVRHVFGDEAYARSSSLFTVLDDLKPADVYLQLIDASLLLDWAFVSAVTFFPGGQALTHCEINECHRRLDRFWKEKEAAWAVKKLRLNFATFSQWFLVTTNELMQDRAGFVQMISIYDADAFEEKIKESRALAVSLRDDAVRSMVARAEEVNKHLIDRKTKRARSERNQITSEKSDVSDLNTSTRGSIPMMSTHVHRFHPTEGFEPVLSRFSEEQKTNMNMTTPPSNDVHLHPPHSPPTVTTTSSRPSSQPIMFATSSSSTMSQRRDIDIDHHIDRIFSTLETSSKDQIVEDASSPSYHNVNHLATNHASNVDFLNDYLNIAHGQYEADDDISPGD